MALLEECSLHDTPAVYSAYDPEGNEAAGKYNYISITTFRGCGVSVLGGMKDIVAIC